MKASDGKIAMVYDQRLESNRLFMVFDGVQPCGQCQTSFVQTYSFV